jgi:ParB family chromosome partitioning protein
VAKRRLGRGIDALIPGSDLPRQEVVEIDPNEIQPDPMQPRQIFDEDRIDELAESLKQHGVIQPLTVRRVNGEYRLVAGERRLRAAIKAQMKTVPVVIRQMDDREAMEVALVENLQREELGPLEQAGAFQLLIEEFGLTQEELATRVGKSRSEVANTLRLLKLEPEVKEMVTNGTLSAGHARALLSLDRNTQIKMARSVVSKGLTVRKLEELVSKRAKKKEPQSVARKKVRRRDAEELLTGALGSPVQVTVQGRRGTISISFFGEEDLERLVEMIRGRM